MEQPRKHASIGKAMNTAKIGLVTLALGLVAASFGETTATVASSNQVKAVASELLGGPSFGVRVGAGNWNRYVWSGGLDVTAKLPILPLPAIRADIEGWTQSSPFGKNRVGDAFSVLGIQNLPVAGYVGIGPSYYWYNNNGTHKNGVGAKVLAGINLPHSLFAEASTILGVSPSPVLFSLGMRF